MILNEEIYMNDDLNYLLNDEIPIDQRLDYFVKKVEGMGYKMEAVSLGSLDEYVLSEVLSISPQIVMTYFELYLLNDDELKQIMDRELDMGIIRTLMLIEPPYRELIYDELDRIMRSSHPLRDIISFLNNCEWRMTIKNLYENVNSSYWTAVSSYLKDANITDGTININFRKLLYKITRYDATPNQLAWLERAIIHDYDKGLGVFQAATFKEKFPKEVKFIQKFLDGHNMFKIGAES